MLYITPLIPYASPLIGRSVRVLKHHRRVGGQVGTVQDLFWKGNEPWLVIQLTSGRRAAVAYGWTDLPPEACPMQMTEPELLPSVACKPTVLPIASASGRRGRSDAPGVGLIT
jgi:hypothetical protein